MRAAIKPPRTGLHSNASSPHHGQNATAIRHQRIATIPLNPRPMAPEVMKVAEDVTSAVRQLKQERDTWKAVALQYKTAFEAQTARLQELQDICIATQAELENEKTDKSQRPLDLADGQNSEPGGVDGAGDRLDKQRFGTADILEPSQSQTERRNIAHACSNLCFRRVESFVEQRNYGIALIEAERLLRGPLTPTARAEGLLLKSAIYRASGSDCLYDALAACSEALELCDHLSELASFLPRIQFQRGICYYQLRMLQQAKDAFDAAGIGADIDLYRTSCEDELEALRYATRRSGFEEHRAAVQGICAQLEGEPHMSKRRRVSAQLQRIPIAKGKRLALPKRWTTGRSTSQGHEMPCLDNFEGS